MRYIRIYNADDGTSRFEDGEVSFDDAMFAPPAPPVGVSPTTSAHELLFSRVPTGWADSAHPAPAPQRMFVFSGVGDSTAGSGTRRCGAGGALVIEDTAAL